MGCREGILAGGSSWRIEARGSTDAWEGVKRVGQAEVRTCNRLYDRGRMCNRGGPTEARDPACPGRALYATELGLTLGRRAARGSSHPGPSAHLPSANLEPLHPPDPCNIYDHHLLDAGPP